jgi:hypothetical protein
VGLGEVEWIDVPGDFDCDTIARENFGEKEDDEEEVGLG